MTGSLATAVSWLFVPATRPERFAKAASGGADVVIIDLEDAVAPADKATARVALREHWPVESPVPVVVRVNAIGTPEATEDLAACRALAPAAVVLPKAESAEDVRTTAEAAGVAVLPLIESARGLVNLAGIVAAGPVVRLLFGSIDLGLDLGVTADAALDPSRSDLVRWSVVGSLPAPVDGVSTAIRDTDAVRRDGARAKAWGFGGKLCIHPVQVPLVHAAFAPPEAEVDWARRVLAADRGGAAAVDGEMIDRPVVERARRILREAERAR
ncbi:HpcH/HpaI aldolase/citrate lyase family protein [Amycolatopsis magusensis]|uniref:HpcH/HpaI aldolase/citrate lyase family protein n=1 Tax=Amycolatopsis magusensis TaxID=882444 RepID=UPI0024A8C546|nr:CoA ester lyase [Amycolatopsis magusensis]MDI5979159.1 CoA ester lyase [Amycolatopsis magusensis]